MEDTGQSLPFDTDRELAPTAGKAHPPHAHHRQDRAGLPSIPSDRALIPDSLCRLANVAPVPEALPALRPPRRLEARRRVLRVEPETAWLSNTVRILPRLSRHS